MSSSITSDHQSQQFLKASLEAIIRAENNDRVPARFTGTGKEIWNTFCNELTITDLIALSIQDAGATMPIPFDPAQWWPDWPEWGLFHSSLPHAEGWIDEALAQADQPRDAYLSRQAAALGIDLPADDIVAALPTPPRHERWLELPGTGGWLAYALCTRAQADLYFWENFTIICGTPQEMLMAGLIAWELGAPPRTQLPIRLDDADLSATLKSGHRYDGTLGKQSLHGHRDLRILLENGGQLLWM